MPAGATTEKQVVEVPSLEPPTKKVKQSAREDVKPEPLGTTDPVTKELLEEAQPKNHEQNQGGMKFEGANIGGNDQIGGYFEETKEETLDTSEDVLKKVDELVEASIKEEKESPRKKANPYNLTPGVSPFPQHVMPTPEACEEVHRLLTELHGDFSRPLVIPQASMEVTGCGEVPDMLDALMRTLLSAATNDKNSNSAMQGLEKQFGQRFSGSVNWDAVREADLDTVIKSIKSGGLANRKGDYIKRCLDFVYQHNTGRLNALLEEKQTSKSPEVIDAKIAKLKENMLSMDYISEMSDHNDAIASLVEMPGIGPKTASCVILFNVQKPSFAVDTHVWRQCKWLGWVPPTASRTKAQSHCEVRVPDHLKYGLHQLFYNHGRTCGRCKSNTNWGTKKWRDTVCPIEHLVTRMEERKNPPAKRTAAMRDKRLAKLLGGRGKKRADFDDETDGSDIEMGDVGSEEDD